MPFEKCLDYSNQFEVVVEKHRKSSSAYCTKSLRVSGHGHGPSKCMKGMGVKGSDALHNMEGDAMAC